MADLHVTSSTLALRFSRGEKVGGLVADLSVPLTAVVDVEVVAEPLREKLGLRFPGLDLPGVRKVGTWRRRGERTLVSVRKGQPALRVRLTGRRYGALLVGADDAAALAADIAAARTAAGGVREVRIRIDGEPPLGATLTLPADSGAPVPAVVLASGSGPLDRDSNDRRARFDVAAQLAGALAGAGLASLRYDKRGVGESPGDWRAAGLSDNVDDLGRARAALAARPEVDADRILLAGHSEGALLATALAARGAPVRGVVLLSASATPGEELLRWQARRIAPTLPRPVRAVLRLLRVDLDKKVAANHEKIKATTTDVARLGGAKVNARWLREFLAHDPRTDLARISVPVLAITGEKDLQVPTADLDVIAATVRGPVQVHRFPDLTHTLRSQAGAPSLGAYRKELREPVNPEVLGAVIQWCREVAGLDRVPD